MARRSNLPLALGILALVIGAALVLLVLQDEDDDAGSSSGSRLSPDAVVYVATKNLSAGTSGTDLIADKAVETRKIPTRERLADAITAQAQLEGMILSADVAVGSQLRLSQFRSTAVRSAAIKIPDGMQAVAVEVPFVPGVAGYVGPEDRVNLYGVIKPAANVPQTVKLVLSNVQVIDVSAEVAPRRSATEQSGARSGGSALTYLLALTPTDAAKVIYLTEYEEIYLTLLPKDQGNSSAPGVVVGDLLR